MNDQLTQAQKDGIKNAITNQTFVPMVEIGKLVGEGYDIEVAKELVIAEIKAYKKEAFEEKLRMENQGSLRYVMFIVVFLVGLVG